MFSCGERVLSLKGDLVKADIPKELYMAVVRLQAAEGTADWLEACRRVAEFVDRNS